MFFVCLFNLIRGYFSILFFSFSFIFREWKGGREMGECCIYTKCQLYYIPIFHIYIAMFISMQSISTFCGFSHNNISLSQLLFISILYLGILYNQVEFLFWLLSIAALLYSCAIKFLMNFWLLSWVISLGVWWKLSLIYKLIWKVFTFSLFIDKMYHHMFRSGFNSLNNILAFSSNISVPYTLLFPFVNFIS